MKTEQRGYFLLEALIVIIVVGLLLAAVVPSLISVAQARNESNVLTAMQRVITAEETYKSNYSSYPTTVSYLTACDSPADQYGACLLPTAVTSGPVYSYTFAITAASDGSTYSVTAVPSNKYTGRKSFCSYGDGWVHGTVMGLAACNNSAPIVATAIKGAPGQNGTNGYNGVGSPGPQGPCGAGGNGGDAGGGGGGGNVGGSNGTPGSNGGNGANGVSSSGTSPCPGGTGGHGGAGGAAGLAGSGGFGSGNYGNAFPGISGGLLGMLSVGNVGSGDNYPSAKTYVAPANFSVIADGSSGTSASIYPIQGCSGSACAFWLPSTWTPTFHSMTVNIVGSNYNTICSESGYLPALNCTTTVKLLYWTTAGCTGSAQVAGSATNTSNAVALPFPSFTITPTCLMVEVDMYPVGSTGATPESVFWTIY